MMAMEMNDSRELINDRGSGRVATFWHSRTPMERLVMVVAGLEAVIVLGFVIGVASLTAQINVKEAEISQLSALLDECEAGELTTASDTTTNVNTATITSPVPSLPSITTITTAAATTPPASPLPTTTTTITTAAATTTTSPASPLPTTTPPPTTSDSSLSPDFTHI